MRPAYSSANLRTQATCVLHPETVEGPYYIRNELVRSDLREDQAGATLFLDIGVIDIDTCEPIPNAFVELWNANSTGSYGGYHGANGSPDAVHTETFLRGGYFTNDDGVVEITTLFPGFYQGRTAHIHTMIHSNWAGRPNGTLVSDAGSVNHIGQFFFDEAWNDKVFDTVPYNTNAQNRTLNSEDGILQAAGPNAFVDISYAEGEDLSAGLVGYITVVVNKTISYTINNANELR
ncbi:Intradiol ring-cleavage dioxygenase [Ephemerocybe angulata]|uniref:Intradiol ring-cleavage dioxygenase n=1 Tax=Ephemerocybe angulata TaxID=980116 RepID=A0A8H6M4I5_9AGAR|nr:Intradiol ring-cleavage dioxygenase [Tulosesus angulatus]